MSRARKNESAAHRKERNRQRIRAATKRESRRWSRIAVLPDAVPSPRKLKRGLLDKIKSALGAKP